MVALPLGRPGDRLLDDEPRPAPDPALTREPADVAARREALRHPPPAPPGPSRFRERIDVSRTRHLSDLRNLAGVGEDSRRLSWLTLDLARGGLDRRGGHRLTDQNASSPDDLPCPPES